MEVEQAFCNLGNKQLIINSLASTTMKKLFLLFAVPIVYAGCSDSKTEVELAKQHILDSINSAANINRVVDSMNALANPEMLGIENGAVIIDPATGKPVANSSVSNTQQSANSQTAETTVSSGNSGQATHADTKDNTTTASTGSTSTEKKR